MSADGIESNTITMHTLAHLPGGAIVAASHDHPGRQFLIIPKRAPADLNECIDQIRDYQPTEQD